MDRKQEDNDTVPRVEEIPADDVEALQAISILEAIVEKNIGTASDGRL